MMEGLSGVSVRGLHTADAPRGGKDYQQQRENEERRYKKAQCNMPVEWRDEKLPPKIEHDHQRERVTG
jgi:hypothetical protein